MTAPETNERTNQQKKPHAVPPTSSTNILPPIVLEQTPLVVQVFLSEKKKFIVLHNASAAIDLFVRFVNLPERGTRNARRRAFLLFLRICVVDKYETIGSAVVGE